MEFQFHQNPYDAGQAALDAASPSARELRDRTKEFRRERSVEQFPELLRALLKVRFEVLQYGHGEALRGLGALMAEIRCPRVGEGNPHAPFGETEPFVKYLSGQRFSEHREQMFAEARYISWLADRLAVEPLGADVARELALLPNSQQDRGMHVHFVRRDRALCEMETPPDGWGRMRALPEFLLRALTSTVLPGIESHRDRQREQHGTKEAKDAARSVVAFAYEKLSHERQTPVPAERCYGALLTVLNTVGRGRHLANWERYEPAERYALVAEKMKNVVELFSGEQLWNNLSRWSFTRSYGFGADRIRRLQGSDSELRVLRDLPALLRHLNREGQSIGFNKVEQRVREEFLLEFPPPWGQPAVLETFKEKNNRFGAGFLAAEADISFGFPSFKYDARSALEGRPSVLQRFLGQIAPNTSVYRAPQESRLPWGGGVIFTPEQLEIVFSDSVQEMREWMAPAVSQRARELITSTEVVMYDGAFVHSSPELQLEVGTRREPYSLVTYNPVRNGVTGATILLVPSVALPLGELRRNMGKVRDGVINQFHLGSIARSAAGAQLPLFDFAHPATLITGAMHPVVLDRELAPHVEFEGMSPEQWLQVREVTSLYWQMHRYLHCALGYYKSTARVNHEFLDGEVQEMDLMASEFLAWHERVQAEGEGFLEPILRVFPFHYRRSEYPGEDSFSGKTMNLLKKGFIGDPRSLRFVLNAGLSLDEWRTNIALRAHGRAIAPKDIGVFWDEEIVPRLFSSQDGALAWQGVEPRFITRWRRNDEQMS
ncbi:hypothetical protein MRY87_12800 [bacterium]|nr:hypothetical protein [bacterium]